MIPRLEEFRAVVERTTDPADYPLAETIERNVPVYGRRLPGPEEVIRALADGPGIVVLRQAFDPATVDRATGVFAAMIAEQKAAGTVTGDHFAQPGATPSAIQVITPHNAPPVGFG